MKQSYTPSQIRTAYGLNLISNLNKAPGYGIKIAIISCYHYSNLQYDLNKYCSKYNLVPITLNIVNQAGNISNNNMALITCASVQLINIVSPGAITYVIEAKSSNPNDIFTAIKSAVNIRVDIICIPFGIEEFSTEASKEHLFLNSNISFITVSGSNNNVLYPSSSSNALSVGGTNLNLNSNGLRIDETHWYKSGSGMSSYIAKPSYQSNVNSNNFRNVPDVSLLADPGILTYCSILGGYFPTEGNIVSCNLMAGIIAISNQLRKIENKPMLNTLSTSSKCIQTYLYKTIYPNSTLYNNNMYDINSGSTPGYDITTGLGSIKANYFCNELANL